ncbi:hypothetical protein [Nonomuraea polychroma]|uniref:hypothetical protein n=1 Tax=Nonomuraea polychroma TaxID=46176 RepID=UPI00240DDD24|nr:hypothetical protein [Nonomuraea polychroma]
MRRCAAGRRAIRIAFPEGIAYAMTKGAVQTFTLALAKELGPRRAPFTTAGAGSGPGLVLVAHARAVHAAIPGSEYTELDAGHVVLHERSAEVTALIRDFIGQR